MKLAGVMTVLEELAPLRYAESWDNVGLLVGDPRAEIAKVFVTVDYTAEVAAEAAAAGANLVVAYHPPLFAAVKRVPHDALWVDAIRRDVALYSPHTALDVAKGGTNDFLADACGVSADGAERRALRAFVGRAGAGASGAPGASGAAESAAAEPGGIGVGRIGPVARGTSRRAVVERVKTALGLSYVLVAGPLDGEAARVAVSAGAGGDHLEDAIRAGADVFVSGEVRHHDALAAARRGVTVVATLHSNSERAAVRAYAARIGQRIAVIASGVTVMASAADCDPFTVV